MERRDFLMIGGPAALGVTALLANKVSAKNPVKVFEYTFLKSIEPKPDRLIKFIVANWFEMDKIAVKKGLMTNYAVFESEPEDSWNVAVVVGYPTEKGYEAIVDEFKKIRQNHQKVLIDGKDLPELGKIVHSRKLFPRHASKD